MTAINHALTGAVIGVLVGQPAAALPLALASHYVCDAIPHFGVEGAAAKLRRMRQASFRDYLLAEAGLCFLLVVALVVFQPPHWPLAAVCAFLAAAPDLLWINRYVKARARKAWRRGAYARFAGGIQWFERPVGALVEAAWFVAALAVLLPFFR